MPYISWKNQYGSGRKYVPSNAVNARRNTRPRAAGPTRQNKYRNLYLRHVRRTVSPRAWSALMERAMERPWRR